MNPESGLRGRGSVMQDEPEPRLSFLDVAAAVAVGACVGVVVCGAVAVEYWLKGERLPGSWWAWPAVCAAMGAVGALLLCGLDWYRLHRYRNGKGPGVVERAWGCIQVSAMVFICLAILFGACL